MFSLYRAKTRTVTALHFSKKKISKYCNFFLLISFIWLFVLLLTLRPPLEHYETFPSNPNLQQHKKSSVFPICAEREKLYIYIYIITYLYIKSLLRLEETWRPQICLNNLDLNCFFSRKKKKQHSWIVLSICKWIFCSILLDWALPV